MNITWVSRCLLILAFVNLSACASGGGSGGSGNRKGGTALPGSADAEDEPATSMTIRDARIVLVQAGAPEPMIIVNRKHVARQTPEGRRALAIGGARGYKAVSDRVMEALLLSFDNRGYNRFKEPWDPSDERYLTRGASIPRFKGLILVENDGQKSKLVGWQAGGDKEALALQRYAAFVDMKVLVADGYKAVSQVEIVDAGIGLPASDESDPFKKPR